MSTIAAVNSASTLRDNFMKLLVTQLQNQNPLDPMDNAQMTSQLSQLSQLEQLENLNGAFQQILQDEQRGQAAALIDKMVTFFAEGETEPRSARVEAVDASGGEIKLRAGEYVLSLDAVQGITN